MTDPRSTPDPARLVVKEQAQVIAPLTDLYRHPDGPRDRQLLLGARVTVFQHDRDWRYVQAHDDGYCGFVAADALGPSDTPTHFVRNAATHSYTAPDMKSRDLLALSLGAQVTVTDDENGFAKTPQGYIPSQHLRPLTQPEDDLVAVAERLLGTPYLWGGNSRWGIDCSGLVQAACRACGIPCPGDSDQQEKALGQLLEPNTPPKRGDLIFWKGHIALLWDAETLIHANAHAMSTVLEPLEAAINRIAKTDGPITAHRRL